MLLLAHYFMQRINEAKLLPALSTQCAHSHEFTIVAYSKDAINMVYQKDKEGPSGLQTLYVLAWAGYAKVPYGINSR
jgi:hypothetical protein